MSVYLVDYENVNADGFRGVEHLNKDDSVYVFYTTNAENLSFELHKKLVESAAEIKYFSVASGKNALDFQLSMFAGYLVGKGTTQNIYIISNDKGFDADTAFYDNFLISENVDVVRCTSIASTLVSKEKKRKVKITKSDGGVRQDTLYSALCALLPDYSSCDVINISTILMSTADKRELHTELVARFRQQKGEEIYTALKADFVKLRAYDPVCVKVREFLKNYSEADAVSITSVIKKTEDKNKFYVELVAKFGQKKGLDVYNRLKKHFLNIKKIA